MLTPRHRELTATIRRFQIHHKLLDTIAIRFTDLLNLTTAPGQKLRVASINPGVEVPTGRVFDKLERSDNAGMDELPEALDYPGFVEWLAAQRNDLQAPAEAIAPEIARALKRLRAMPGVDLALMSGSGATCIGLTRDMGRARQVARAIQLSEMGWWVAPAPLLS